MMDSVRCHHGENDAEDVTGTLDALYERGRPDEALESGTDRSWG